MMNASILPFLPRLQNTDSGALRWPSELGFALKSLVAGPSTSGIHGSEALCDFITDLREQSRLPVLSTAVLHGITTYFDEFITHAAAANFYQDVLPFIGDLALRLPSLINEHFKQSTTFSPLSKLVHLRLLELQHPGLVYMTQELVAALLACAFFCLYPSKGRDEARLPYFNLNGLFEKIGNDMPQQEQKVHCILHYFTRLSHNVPQGMISFERKVLLRNQHHEILCPISEPSESYWSKSSASFCPIQVFEDGMIEDQSSSALEIDFANRYLGGGVLRQGCVQEEIRFLISPELIAGMLFIPAMQSNESIEIRGAERFSCYSGYSSSFCFAGDHIDTKPRDGQGRRKTRIVAIDALVHPGKHQYKEALMLREVNKAFCGFLDHVESYSVGVSSQPKVKELQIGPFVNSKDEAASSENTDIAILQNDSANIGIATGNWGCGAFGGDMELKSLLQWMAASQAGRPFLHYYTFGSSHGQRLQQVADWIINEKWVVGELWGLLVDYGEKRLQGLHEKGIFEWIVPLLAKPIPEVSQQEAKGSVVWKSFTMAQL